MIIVKGVLSEKHWIDVSYFNDEYLTVNCKCNGCEVSESYLVEQSLFDKWAKGALLQDVFPLLTPGQREMLISGTCDACWDKKWADLD